MDARGKITNPTDKISRDNTEKQITRVNDFVIELVEGCRRGIYMVDMEELDNELKLNLISELEFIWDKKSKDSVNKLKIFRNISLED